MRAILLATLAALVAAGCSKTGAPEPPAREAAAEAAPSGDRAPMAMEAQDVELRLFDAKPTRGAPRKPTFWIHFDVYTLSEDNVWSFERAQAIIYGRTEDEQIKLEAEKGQFQKDQMAYLEGGITAQVMDMRMELTDIEWLNEERIARTDKPLAIQTGDSHLKAGSLCLYPDEQRLEMTQVNGTLKFGGFER